MNRALYALSLLALSAQASAGIIHVDASATGTGDGSSWANAQVSLRAALDGAVAGDDLWIAAGTYVPGPTAEATDSFFLKSGVRLYGGFAGGETSLAQRDWVLNPTVLSGDVAQDDVNTGGPGWDINTRNSAHVLTANGVDSSCVLDGLIISDGHIGPAGTIAGDLDMAGGGLYNVNSSPTVTNCTFQYNTAAWAWGAAIYNFNSSPTITHCVFLGNNVHLSNGAGIGNIGNSSPIIQDCEFIGNSVTTGGGGQEGQGAAISNYWDVPPITVERCIFTGNIAKQFFSSGHGIEQARGGAISSFADGLTVKDCTFKNNQANAGGAIFVWGSSTIMNSLFTSNKVYNMISGGITVSGYASAIGAWTNPDEDTVVANCGIIDNQVVGGESGAVVCTGGSSILLSNSILWGNTAPPPASPRQVHYKGNIVLSHDVIENLFVPHVDDEVPQPESIPGCIDLDPLFVNAALGDYSLSAGSPAIDAGSNALVPGLGNTDLAGNDRVAVGASSLTVDMGPYEFGSAAPGPCPSIVSAPGDLIVTLGGSARFDVLAQGVELSYQWRRDGVALSDGLAISGATSPTLLISSTTFAHAGNYDVVVMNGCSSIASSPATLTVANPPLGTVLCSGDGSGPGCPCGNDKDPGEGCQNSTGNGGRISGAGTPSLFAADAVITATDLPQDQPGIFFMGSNLVNGGVGVAFGDGLRCVQATKRFAVQYSGPEGVLTLSDPASLAPTEISPGATRYFQGWFRDPVGPCSSGWNTTPAYEVTFTP